MKWAAVVNAAALFSPILCPTPSKQRQPAVGMGPDGTLLPDIKRNSGPKKITPKLIVCSTSKQVINPSPFMVSISSINGSFVELYSAMAEPGQCGMAATEFRSPGPSTPSQKIFKRKKSFFDGGVEGASAVCPVLEHLPFNKITKKKACTILALWACRLQANT